MDGVSWLLRWFTGGDTPYMTLYHCMSHDTLWVVITIALDLAVAGGYALIAVHWWRNQRSLQNPEARRDLGDMRNIFIFCAMCGYLFIPLKLYWPAWRLYDMFLLVLVYFTWRYAWGARELKVIYRELNRTAVIADELLASREESRRKSFFLNAVSHDLRNPLGALMLYGDMAKTELAKGNTEQAREAVETMSDCAKDLRDLLDGFIELGRIDWSDDPPTFCVFDARQLVDRVVRSAAPTAEAKGLTMRINVPHRLQFHTDDSKLERVVQNLVYNGIKYTARGSITIAAGQTDRHWWIDVIDTGIGITDEDRGRIFDDFYQVQNHERKREQGFGIGLAICRRLVDQLGGRLELESEVGGGSRFRILLPRAANGQAIDLHAEPLAGTTD